MTARYVCVDFGSTFTKAIAVDAGSGDLVARAEHRTTVDTDVMDGWYRCREQRCAGRTFLLDYSYPGQSPAVKQQIVEMAMNASGIRDTARVLHISTNTVLTELKKRNLTSTR